MENSTSNIWNKTKKNESTIHIVGYVSWLGHVTYHSRIWYSYQIKCFRGFRWECLFAATKDPAMNKFLLFFLSIWVILTAKYSLYCMMIDCLLCGEKKPEIVEFEWMIGTLEIEKNYDYNRIIIKRRRRRKRWTFVLDYKNRSQSAYFHFQAALCIMNITDKRAYSMHLILTDCNMYVSEWLWFFIVKLDSPSA